MPRFITRFTFIGGFFTGVSLAIIIVLISKKTLKLATPETLVNGPFVHYEKWFATNNFKHFQIPLDLLRYTNHNYLLESSYLYDSVKVACVILVHNVNNTRAAIATWAKHCNSVSLLNTTHAKLSSLSSRRENHAWLNMCNHLQKLPKVFDWVLVVSDDTYVILENIRYFVAGLDSRKPYYLGHTITFWGVTYNSAQAGYLLSNATVTALKNYKCKTDSSILNLEDYYLGKVLFGLNITPDDTRDVYGLSTFHGFNLVKLFFPGSTVLTNYYKFSAYPIKCCSYNSVTFKVSTSDQMYTYEYLLYQLQIFKHGQHGNVIPTTHNPEKMVWQDFLKEQGLSNANDVDANTYLQLWQNVIKPTVRKRTNILDF